MGRVEVCEGWGVLGALMPSVAYGSKGRRQGFLFGVCRCGGRSVRVPGCVCVSVSVRERERGEREGGVE